MAKLSAGLHWMNKTTSGISRQSKSDISVSATIQGSEINTALIKAIWKSSLGIGQAISAK